MILHSVICTLLLFSSIAFAYISWHLVSGFTSGMLFMYLVELRYKFGSPEPKKQNVPNIESSDIDAITPVEVYDKNGNKIMIH